MEQGTRGVVWAVVGSLLMASSPLFAHHSESMLDKNGLVTIQGVITEHLMVNPHQIIKLKVSDPSGKVTLWTVQGTSVPMMRDIGWTRDYLKAGDQVRMAVYACRDGRPCGSWMRIVKADGTELPLPPFKKRMLGEYLQLHGSELSDEEYEIYKKSVTTGVGALPDPKKSAKIEADPTKEY
jgi:hypothetical protein